MGLVIVKRYTLPLFVLLAFLALPQAIVAKESVCINCHEGLGQHKGIIEQYRKSVHFRNGISCHHCHGGNQDNEDTAMDPASAVSGRAASRSA